MQTITSAQCRAARALLNWTQPELADRCGIHVQTISNFEKEESSPSKKTLEKLVETFVLGGIDFLDGGVRTIGNQIQSYKGIDGFINFRIDVYETIKNGGDVFVTNVDEREYTKWEGDGLSLHLSRMKSIKNLNFLIITHEGNDYFPARAYAAYRTIPKSDFENISLYIYGDKTSFISFQPDDVKVFVIDHAPVTKYFKESFMRTWKAAKPVNTEKSP